MGFIKWMRDVRTTWQLCRAYRKYLKNVQKILEIADAVKNRTAASPDESAWEISSEQIAYLLAWIASPPGTPCPRLLVLGKKKIVTNPDWGNGDPSKR